MSTKLPQVLLVGLPNSGKSTLFNRLTHSSAAITSKQPNTTRDTNKGTARFGERAFLVVDSAGFTKPNEPIIAEAMQLLTDELTKSQAVIFLVDGTTSLTQKDRELAKQLHKSGLPIFFAINKSDRTKLLQPSGEFSKLGFNNTYAIAALDGRSIDELITDVLKVIPVAKPTKVSQPIRVALLGRPNVGKSSLLNALAGEKLAIESDIAHTTRDTNRFSLNFYGKSIEVIDTAGLRRPGKIGRKGVGSEIEFYSSLRTKKAIESADICLALVDGSEPLTAQDQRILGLLKDEHKACIVVVTKWDNIDDKDSNTMAEYTQILHAKLQYIYWAPLIFTSAKTGQNLEDLKKLIVEVYTRLDFSLSTAKLNRFIEDANAINPPSAVKTRRPKVNYATQTGTRPPKFTIFCTHPSQMHWSYTRFLQNRLRQNYELSGVPIIIEYRSKYSEENRRN
ncbi:MAG: ribosome biogenesis GTPase Der [Candidatus Saccharibacteria bacterium]